MNQINTMKKIFIFIINVFILIAGAYYLEAKSSSNNTQKTTKIYSQNSFNGNQSQDTSSQALPQQRKSSLKTRTS